MLRWPIIFSFLLMAGPVHAEPSGTWRLSDGKLQSRPCIPLSEYGDLTPIPGGCKVLIEDGGILYSFEADARVHAKLKKMESLIKPLELGVKRLSESTHSLASTCSEGVTSLESSVRSCITAIESGHNAARWPWFFAGTGLGATFVSLLVVLL